MNDSRAFRAFVKLGGACAIVGFVTSLMCCCLLVALLLHTIFISWTYC